MKLGLVTSGSFALGLLLTSAGCSAPRDHARTAAEKTAQVQAALEGRTATTELMSADLGAAPPRVGKSYLAGERGEESEGASAPAGSGPLLASPKDDAQSDCPRRGGRFGSAK